ncbi:MAG: hypothetical protein KKH01_04490 [Firmicutes bacterium]|nr:hypothetical protein [Bacillota bacterium]
MKKIYLSSIILFIFTLVACTQIDPETVLTLPQTLKEAVTIYNEKLTFLIESESETNSDNVVLTRFYNDTPYNADDMIYKDIYLEVYNKQKDNSNHVYLTEHLLQYKLLLDEINTLLVSYDIDELEANIDINFQNNLSIEANVFLSQDRGVVIKFASVSLFSEEPVFYGIKMGYENNIFFVKQFINYTERDTYSYFEFMENVSLIQISYRDEDNFRYQYVNQVDNELFEVYYASNDYGPSEYTLMWFNPDTNIRSIYHDGYDSIRHFEVFNEKTSIFDYTDYLDGNISLRFQLLEASGWDYAYLDSNAHPDEGVYKNGVMLFEPDEYRQFNVDLNYTYQFANVGVTIDLKQEELTNEILSLETYQMNFNHPEITIDYISETFYNLYEESKHLAVYRGIDFYSGNIQTTLYDEIDDDLKELND